MTILKPFRGWKIEADHASRWWSVRAVKKGKTVTAAFEDLGPTGHFSANEPVLRSIIVHAIKAFEATEADL